jgi:hypothetical protein
MRTIVKTELVPAEEVTYTTYGCDLCDFTSDDEDNIKLHHGKEHACKRKMEVDGVELYWFDTEEDAQTWIEQDEYGADERKVRWSDPGWYTASWSTGPCRRGCCTRSCRSLESVGSYLSELEYAAEQAEQQADKKRRLAQAIRQEVGDG